MVNPKPKRRVAIEVSSKAKAPLMKLVPSKISVTISKTRQVPKFNPSVITWTEEYVLQPDDDPRAVREALYATCSRTVKKHMATELAKWEADGEE